MLEGAFANGEWYIHFFVTKKNVEQGKHVGYFVYENSNLLGWTGSGPKTAFRLLKDKLGNRLSEFSDNIWSIGCIALTEGARGRNLSEAVVRAVIEKAKATGAKILEAYPTRPFHEPSMYRGSHKLYERMGFNEVGSEKDDDFEILLVRYSLIRDDQLMGVGI